MASLSYFASYTAGVEGTPVHPDVDSAPLGYLNAERVVTHYQCSPGLDESNNVVPGNLRTWDAGVLYGSDILELKYSWLWNDTISALSILYRTLGQVVYSPDGTTKYLCSWEQNGFRVDYHIGGKRGAPVSINLRVQETL